MKIGFDLTIANVTQAGTSIYARSLLEALKRSDDQNEYVVLAASTRRSIDGSKTLGSRINTLYRDLIWMHLQVPWKANRSKLDILHEPANYVPAFPSCPTVVTIMDTIVFQMPEYFTSWHKTYARVFLPIAAKKAAAILTISEESKRQIVNRLAVKPEKVFVTTLAASSEFKPLASEKINALKKKYSLNSFILTVGTLEPRKNIIRLLQAYDLLRKKGLTQHHLVHAGPQGWLFKDILQEVERLGLRDSVKFLGLVPMEDLVSLYNAASVFVYPSLYEGFGLPVLEAMSCGCPVITSNLSSLPEVLGDAGILIDPNNHEEIADAMHLILGDPSYGDRLRDMGLQRAARFSWDRCARETLDVYRRLYK